MLDKVSIRSLPVLEGPPERPVLDGARIRMTAGEMAPILNGGPWHFVAYLEFLAGTGAWRGGHYHEQRRESFYVIAGRLRAAFEDVDTGETAETELRAGDLVVIEPRCAHAFAAIEYAQALECATHTYDAADTIPRLPRAARPA